MNFIFRDSVESDIMQPNVVVTHAAHFALARHCHYWRRLHRRSVMMTQIVLVMKILVLGLDNDNLL